jgi:Transposase
MEDTDWRAFAALRRSELKTARAWALKETAMSLYNYTYEGSAQKYFKWWHSWVVRSRLRPIVEVAGLLKRSFANIIRYLKHRITNAASESRNAKIQWVKYTARASATSRTSSMRSTPTTVACTWPLHPLNGLKPNFGETSVFESVDNGPLSSVCRVIFDGRRNNPVAAIGNARKRLPYIRTSFEGST